SMVLALVLFAVLGFVMPAPADATQLEGIMTALRERFAVGPHMLLPAVLVIGMVVKKVPALPALLIGALVGCVFAVIFQQEAVRALVNGPSLPLGTALVKGAWIALFDGYSLESGNAALGELLSRGGMSSMLST